MKLIRQIITLCIIAVLLVGGVYLYDHPKEFAQWKKQATEYIASLSGQKQAPAPIAKATPTPKPKPIAVATPTPKPKPVVVATPTSKPVNPNDPKQVMLSLNKSREEWPGQVICKKSIAFPAMLNGKPIGSVKASAGITARLVAVKGDKLIVEYHGGQAEISAADTDIVSRVLVRRRYVASHPEQPKIVVTNKNASDEILKGSGMPFLTANNALAALRGHTLSVVDGTPFEQFAKTLKQRIMQVDPAVTNQIKATQYAPLMAKPAYVLALAQYEFIQKTGAQNLDSVRSMKGGKPFLKWLMADSKLLNGYLLAGPTPKDNLYGMQQWCKIWNQEKPANRDKYAKLGAAMALSFSKPIGMEDYSGKDVDPVERNNFYVKNNNAGKLLPYFNKASIRDLRNVVNSNHSTAELQWALDGTRAKDKSQKKIGDEAYRVPYRMKNAEGVSVQKGAAYYHHKPATLQLYQSVGGVCGAISRTGTSYSQANGIPAFTVGQPGHCAFIYKTDADSWKLGNDIFGWEKSHNSGTSVKWDISSWSNYGPFALLAEQVFGKDAATYATSARFSWLAKMQNETDLKKKEALLRLATQTCPLNYSAWTAYIDLCKKDNSLTTKDWTQIALDVVKAYRNYAYAADPLVKSFEKEKVLPGMKDSKKLAFFMKIHQMLATSTGKYGGASISSILERNLKTVSEMTKPDAEKTSFFGSTGNGISSEDFMQKVVALYANQPEVFSNISTSYFDIVKDQPAARASAIKFFNSVLAQVQTSPSKKAAVNTCRILILLSEWNDNSSDVRKYTQLCKNLEQQDPKSAKI